MISVNLSTTPFIAQTDSTRLQMASKQILQSLTHPNCEIPLIINEDFLNMSILSSDFTICAGGDGEILCYVDNLLITREDTKLVARELPIIRQSFSNIGIHLLNVKSKGRFKKGDILAEYITKNGIPAFGYNTHVMFWPFFGFNYEDAIVISESFANKAKHFYTQKIYIPIYNDSVFKLLYHGNPFPFNIEDIGNLDITYDVNILCEFTRLNISSLNLHKLLDFISNDNINNAKTTKIISRLRPFIVTDVRIYPYSRNLKDIISDIKYKPLRNYIAQLVSYYSKRIKNVKDALLRVMSSPSCNKIIKQHYLPTSDDIRKLTNILNTDGLVAIIEVNLAQENSTTRGNKFANRYANKGVVSLIIPDDIMPYDRITGDKIEMILNPLGLSRMNWGQIIELCLGKIIKGLCSNTQYIPREKRLDAFIDIMKTIGTSNRSILKFNNLFKHNIYESINNGRFFIICPQFKKIDYKELKKVVDKYKNKFPIVTEVVLPKRLFEFINDLYGSKIININNDWIIKAATGYMYIQKLMHTADSKFNARDFGTYRAITKQPIRGGKGGGGRIGYMEIFALLAHGLDRTIKELRSVKSDKLELKPDLVRQILCKGKYELPIEHAEPYSKIMIENIMKGIAWKIE